MSEKNIDVRITDQELHVDRALEDAASSRAGGTVTFVGTVRDASDGDAVHGLELESAIDLALSDLERIARTALADFNLCRVIVHHRIGKLKVGDKIVVIVVSAPHRDEAFRACRFVIDELKKTTPIWKKELGPSGSAWVGTKA